LEWNIRIGGESTEEDVVCFIGFCFMSVVQGTSLEKSAHFRYYPKIGDSEKGNKILGFREKKYQTKLSIRTKFCF
jgi:hypothetical protein